VEAAIVLPVLILLVFGILEFGLLFNRMQGVHAAARESARLGSLVSVSIDDVRDRAADAAPPFIHVDDLEVTVIRRLVLGDGTTTNDETWVHDPATDTWSGGTTNTGAEVPCHADLEPDPANPPAATDVVVVVTRVELELLNPNEYGVTIPTFGSFAFGHPSTAGFRCEY
jgi:Flp pilus assembly protein TadG